MTKIKLTKPFDTECTPHAGVANVKWGSEVEARVVTPEGKRPCAFIKGSEFIRVGGNPDMFTPDNEYMWGFFEE